MNPPLESTRRAPLSSHYLRTADRCYVACKLATDPLYPAVALALGDNPRPLLDIGCGIGLLALYLRRHGHRAPITGLDYDGRKISSALAAAADAGEASLAFHEFDARLPLPGHEGDVTILDILQFFTPPEQETLLRAAVSRLPAGGRLVIRSGLRDASWRYTLTHSADLFARAAFWMKAAPVHYPNAEFFRRILEPYGSFALTPLWGRTPFNNHLIVLTRATPRRENDLLPKDPSASPPS